MGESPLREGLEETPERFFSLLREIFQNPSEDTIALKTFAAPGYDSWICLERIPFASFCEHHLLPFTGHASVAYWPGGERVVGLSKLVRLTELLARRLQLQERLTVQLAERIFTGLGAKAAAVRIEAEHSCMSLRGVAKPGIRTITSHRCGQAPHWPF